MTEQLKSQIKQLVLERLQRLEANPTLADDDSLVYSARLDSLSVIELATQLEQQFSIDFNKIGFNQYQFDTINSIVELIQSSQ